MVMVIVMVMMAKINQDDEEKNDNHGDHDDQDDLDDHDDYVKVKMNMKMMLAVGECHPCTRLKHVETGLQFWQILLYRTRSCKIWPAENS